jgi:MFS transporter, DHA1 family, multidrug resistance protein
MESLKKNVSPAFALGKGGLVLILGLITASAPFATDMFLSGMPALARTFDTDAGHAQLTLSLFFFGLATGQLVYGPLIDHFGRRRPLLFGVVLFTVSSVLELFTHNLSVFLILRFLQALGGSSGIIIGRAVVFDLFTGHEAARAFSFLMIILGVGPIVAPVLGSVIISVSSWQMILAFLSAFGLLCTLLVTVWFKETLVPENRQLLKMRSIYGVLLSLVCKPSFMVPAVTGGLSMAAMFVFISGSPFVLIEYYHVSPRDYSLLFALNAVGMVVVAQLNSWLVKYFSISLLLNIALTVDCLLMGLLLSLTGHVPLPVFLTILFMGLSLLPLVAANTTAMAMAHSHPFAGNASTIIGVIQFGLAGLCSSLVSMLYDGTPMPMVALLAACAFLAALVQFSQAQPWLALGRAQGK